MDLPPEEAAAGLRGIIAAVPPDTIPDEAKIALNFGVRGEMNLRSFEAPACGALLFVEEELNWV